MMLYAAIQTGFQPGTFNAAQYGDLQQRSPAMIQSYSIAAAYNTLFNAQKVAIKGDQLDILAKVFKDDQFNVNIGYSHARRRCHAAGAYRLAL